jgi:outer membrane protein assembly factor BamA
MFKPTSEFFIDEEKIEGTGGFKLFIDDVAVNAGVSSDQLFLSRSTIFMSDMLGNRRFIASLDSVSTFSNFDFIYMDMRKRLNWGARVFDDRSFYVTQDVQSGDLDQRLLYRQTGAMGLLSYPFTRYHRIDAGAGYISRDAYLPKFEVDETGAEFLNYVKRRDNYPIVSSSFSGDTTEYKSFGPISGRRYELSASYAPDLKDGGMLTGDVTVDFRQYYQMSARTLLAARVFGAYSRGNAANFYYFGGLNTLRGYDFRTLIGNRAGFANFEVRFPLVDVLATPLFVLQQVRGNLFIDVGAAQIEGRDFLFQNDDGLLVDGRASVGYGLSFNMFGMELHWDFAKRFNGKETEGTFRTSFWIGDTF